MKIAYLVNEVPDIRGSARYERAKHLSEKNEVFLFLKKGSTIPDEIQTRVTVMRSGFTSGLWHIPWRFYHVWRMNRKVHFDLICTYYYPFSIVEGYFLKLLGLKWVADIWDHPEQVLDTRETGFWRRLAMKIAIILARRFLKHADLIICGIMTAALQEYNIDPSRTLPITNGVEPDHIRPGKKRRGGSGAFKVFYVGPLGWGRNIDVLLEAITRVGSKIRVELTLAGRVNNSVRPWLSKFISEHDLSKTVKILGEIEPEKVLDLIEESDVCVCPLADINTRKYCYPVKVLQYLAMGKPVVATDLPGVARFINHEENGLLVKAGDPEEMAKAIIRVYEDEELKKKLEGNARPSVLQYDWSIINEKIDGALSALLTA